MSVAGAYLLNIRGDSKATLFKEACVKRKKVEGEAFDGSLQIDSGQ